MAQGQVEGGYAFAQQPRAVSARKKFRDPAGAIDDRLAVNIMRDRRVVRGNTYAAQVLLATAVHCVLKIHIYGKHLAAVPSHPSVKSSL
jgi:hypothetical protein